MSQAPAIVMFCPETVVRATVAVNDDGRPNASKSFCESVECTFSVFPIMLHPFFHGKLGPIRYKMVGLGREM